MVILSEDSVPSIKNVMKSECVRSKIVGYNESSTCSGSPVVCRKVKTPIWRCVTSKSFDGKECKFISSGTVWRYDPELAKRLAIYNKEYAKEQDRIKKNNDLKNTYKERLYSWYKKILEQESFLGSGKYGLRWGFKDINGRIIIEPQFTAAHIHFSEDLAGVAIEEKDEQKWGFIDKTGKWIINPSYEDVCMFTEGLAGARINKKYGVINKAGQLVVKPQYEFITNFSEGMAVVKLSKDGKSGFIDKIGNIVIKPQFDHAQTFSEGLAAVKVDKKYGYLDKKGHFILKPQFDNAERFFDGIAQVKLGNEEKYIDKAGKIIP